MYVIGGDVSDDQVSKIAEEVKQSLVSSTATVEKHDNLGKKKLAYPIKHQKFGTYVVVNFDLASDKIGEVEHRIRTNLSIIRHLILNMDESMERMEKDRKEQSKFKIRRPQEEKVTEPSVRSKVRPSRRVESVKKIQIDLDAEIEKALGSEDLK